MKNLILFLFITCSWVTQAQIINYDKNEFYNIEGYSFTQQQFTNGVRPNPDVISGPLPQNDFTYSVEAQGGIQHVFGRITTVLVNKSITIKFKSNNVKKFGFNITALNISTGQEAPDRIMLIAYKYLSIISFNDF